MSGRVILLNGVSSAGKTTLAKAIQKRAPDIWLHVAMDSFMAMLLDGHEFDRDWFPLREMQRDGKTLPQIGNGPRGEALLAQIGNWSNAWLGAVSTLLSMKWRTHPLLRITDDGWALLASWSKSMRLFLSLNGVNANVAIA